MKKLFLIVSIICFVSCFPANADTRDEAPLEKVSIQHPGFLQASEKAWLAEHPIIMSAADYDFPPFSIANEAGEADGFSVELLKASANALDIDVEFYSAPWAKIKEELATGKLDALPVVGRTPEREADFDFTVPYITIYGNVYVREGDHRIREIEDLEDMQVVVKKKDNAEEFVKRVQISKNIIAIDSFEEAFTLLSKGSYDAIITNEVVGTRVIDKLGIDNIVSILQIDEFKQDFTFAVTEGNKELLALLNEGLSRVVADGTYHRLRAKWFGKPQQIQLTSEERAWLGKNHVVRVRVSDAPPWEINTPKPQGMSVDYLTIIGRQFGINFKFLPGTEAWIDGFNDMAGDHLKYDLLPAVKRTPERLALLAISDDYLHSPWVVFTHEKIFDIFSLEYLRGRKVAVERGYVMQKLLEKNEPEIELVIQESTEDALLAVSTMQADAYVGNLIVTSHLIQRAGIINVKVACPTPFGSHSQAMATRQEWTPLISIINKGLTNISQKEKTNIQNKYSAVRFEHGIRIMDIIKWVIGISIVLLTILSIILLWNRRLKSLVKERTAKLEMEFDEHQQAEEKYHTYVKKSIEGIWAYDLEPPIPMDLPVDDQLDLMYERAYISEANDALARMFGFEKGENMLGMRLDNFQPRKNPENLAYVKNVVREKFNLQNFETTAYGAAGEKRIMISNILGITKNGKLLRIWGTSRDVTEKKKLENELMMNKKDLQKLAGWLISRQEKEKSRVARELHDDLTQQLAVIAIEAGTIEEQFRDLPEPVREKVSQIKERLIKVSKDVHNLSRTLHPSILYDLGLERAVRSECSNFSSRTGIAVVFEPRDVPVNIPKEISLAIYRIIQECLLNISKHAKTKSAYIILERSNGSVVLTVKDSGAGFYPEEVRGQTALGFSSMRERVRLVNGELSITSELGKGTSVEVEIPLKRE